MKLCACGRPSVAVVIRYRVCADCFYRITGRYPKKEERNG